MRIVPEDIAGQIQFFQTHHTPWFNSANAIGTTPAEVSALATKTEAACAAYAAQYAAREAAKTATMKLRHAVAAMAQAGSGIIKQIRARAATDGDGVYTLASIPAPAQPSRIAAPGTPTNFTATLLAVGALQLRWKCPNPAGSTGTLYQIARSVGGGAEGFTPIGLAGRRSFIDSTLPAGSTSILYRITALRSTATGEAALFVVNFGVSGAINAVIVPRRAA